MSSAPTTIRQIGIICIPTTDQAAAVAFYTEKLGFELRVDEPFAGGQMRWIEVAPVGSTASIAIAPPPPGVQTGGMQTGIIFNSTDIEADHAALRAGGVDVDDDVSRMGDGVPPMFWLRDPEGNVLMVAENGR